MLRIPPLPVDCLLAFNKTTTLTEITGRSFEFPSAEIFQAELVDIILPEPGGETHKLYEFRMWIDDPAVGRDHKTFIIREDHVQVAPIPPPIDPRSDRTMGLIGWSVPVPYSG